MYTEIQQHGSYIILISGQCEGWEEDIWKELYELSVGDNARCSWNSKRKYIFCLMSGCTHIKNTKFSRAILSVLQLKEFMNAAVLFLKTNNHAPNDLQQNRNESAQGTYLELHTWYPYGNSEGCNTAEGTVLVNGFTVRNLSGIRRSDILTFRHRASFI